MKSLGTAIFSLAYIIFSLFSLGILLLIPKKKFHQIYQNLADREATARIHSMRPHVTRGQRILDVGAGSGKFAARLRDELGVEIQGVDVVDYDLGDITIHAFDGNTLPLPDQSFDVVFAAFVLHHCENPQKLFEEMFRVSKNKIIIFEDTFDNFPQKIFTAWNDYHTNIWQGHIKVWKQWEKPGITQMPMPLKFKSIREWELFFKNYPVQIKSQSLRHAKYKPLSKVTFCLEKDCPFPST